VFCGALLGTLPFRSAELAKVAVDESFEAVFNPTSTERLKLFRIHCFYLRDQGRTV